MLFSMFCGYISSAMSLCTLPRIAALTLLWAAGKWAATQEIMLQYCPKGPSCRFINLLRIFCRPSCCMLLNWQVASWCFSIILKKLHDISWCFLKSLELMTHILPLYLRDQTSATIIPCINGAAAAAVHAALNYAENTLSAVLKKYKSCKLLAKRGRTELHLLPLHARIVYCYYYCKPLRCSHSLRLDCHTKDISAVYRCPINIGL